MTDHWGFVAAAYGLAAVVLLGHWRRLRRRERELNAAAASSVARPAQPGVAGVRGRSVTEEGRGATTQK
jgi:hypothetical protein